MPLAESWLLGHRLKILPGLAQAALGMLRSTLHTWVDLLLRAAGASTQQQWLICENQAAQRQPRGRAGTRSPRPLCPVPQALWYTNPASAMKQKAATAAPQLPGLVARLLAGRRHSPAKPPRLPPAPLLPKPVFWLALLLLSLAPQHVGAALGRQLRRLLERRRASPAAWQDAGPKGSRPGSQGRAGSPGFPASTHPPRCAQMLGMLKGQWGVLGRNGGAGAAADASPGRALHDPRPSLLPPRLGTALMQRSQAGFWSGKGSVIPYLCPRTDRVVINTVFESCRQKLHENYLL